MCTYLLHSVRKSPKCLLFPVTSLLQRALTRFLTQGSKTREVSHIPLKQICDLDRTQLVCDGIQIPVFGSLTSRMLIQYSGHTPLSLGGTLLPALALNVGNKQNS